MADDFDFYPFGRADAVCATSCTSDSMPGVVRVTSKTRAKAGPKSIVRDDAAIAERDNLRALGRK